jgi:hypothetical protein
MYQEGRIYKMKHRFYAIYTQTKNDPSDKWEDIDPEPYDFFETRSQAEKARRCLTAQKNPLTRVIIHPEEPIDMILGIGL